MSSQAKTEKGHITRSYSKLCALIQYIKDNKVAELNEIQTDALDKLSVCKELLEVDMELHKHLMTGILWNYRTFRWLRELQNLG